MLHTPNTGWNFNFNFFVLKSWKNTKKHKKTHKKKLPQNLAKNVSLSLHQNASRRFYSPKNTFSLPKKCVHIQKAEKLSKKITNTFSLVNKRLCLLCCQMARFISKGKTEWKGEEFHMGIDWFASLFKIEEMIYDHKNICTTLFRRWLYQLFAWLTLN